MSRFAGTRFRWVLAGVLGVLVAGPVIAANVNDALQGTFGTPSNTNRFVTATDPAHSGTVTNIATTSPILGGPITTTGTISHATSGISAATYGSASSVPVCAFNATGHATSCTNTSIDIAASQIGSGTLATARGGTNLDTSGSTGVPTISSGTWSVNSTLGVSLGGTGANNTATLNRYLKGDGTNFVTSSGSASGVGTCTNQFARVLNSDAAPTCSSVADADFTGQLAVTHGGTGASSFGAAAGALVTSGTSGTGALSRVDAVASGSVLASNGTNANPTYTTSPSITAITLSGLTSTGTLRVGGGATIASFLTATATLDFPSVSTAACSLSGNITVTGAAANDEVVVGPPTSNLTTKNGTNYFGWVSASNTVVVDYCNLSGASFDPASGTFRVTVIHH